MNPTSPTKKVTCTACGAADVDWEDGQGIGYIDPDSGRGYCWECGEEMPQPLRP